MYTTPTSGFRGFVWEPASEQDVVILFGRLLERGDLNLAVDSAWTAFPDCTAIDPASQKRINIEFEFRSSSFWTHRAEWRQLEAADPTAEWWVVSWKDDLTPNQRNKLTALRVIGLRELVKEYDHTHEEQTVLNWYEGEPDDARAMFEWRSAGLSDDRRQLLLRLRDFGASTPGFRLGWPAKPDLPWFTVRDDVTGIECFKVFSTGSIAFPLHRWTAIPPKARASALRTLNATLGTRWFTGKELTKKGCDAMWLIGGKVDAFLALWKTNLLR